METMSCEGVTYKFDAITIDGEEEWARWVRETAMTEAMTVSDGWPIELRAAFLAKVSTEAALSKCGFTTPFGLENFLTADGTAKALELASRKYHPAPYVPFEELLRMVKANEMKAVQVALRVIPVSEEFRTAALEEVEKKVSGRKAGRSPRPLNSDAPSAANPGVSPPKLSAG